MPSVKNMLSAAAGAGGDALNVEDVFSTYLYEGNSTDNTTITNNIDLSTEGGMVWIKRRDNSGDHSVFDTERGVEKRLITNATSSEFDLTSINISGLSAFNTDGFDLGRWTTVNENTDDFVSWTFRKAPKFFDIQKFTITRDGSNNLSSSSSNVTITSGIVYISHDLGSAPGIWTQKSMDASSNWFVRGTDFSGYLQLNKTNAKAGSATFSSTSTQVELGNYGYFGVGTQEYVVYLFAHNNGDGEFGPDGDADIIKCGSYTGNGSDGNNGQVIDLGFEPQWVMVKNADGTGNWIIVDNMRGFPGAYSFGVLYAEMLQANTTIAEDPDEWFKVLPNGFQLTDSATDINSSGDDYIYIAIHRGPMAVPESASEVFAIDTQYSANDGRFPLHRSNKPVDFAFFRYAPGTSAWAASSRLNAGTELFLDKTNAESSAANYAFDYQDGWRKKASLSASADTYSWMWSRAPNYFDVVAFTAGTSANRRLDHNLGVAPEMAWVKRRDGARNWYVYHKDMDASPRNYRMYLNSGQAIAGPTNDIWGTSDPTATDFGLNENDVVGSNGSGCIAYLFATLSGVSKVGSYTGNGSSQTIDCGFSSGARFVLLKQVDGTADWALFDTERGIVAGDDALLRLNTTGAESTALGDIIDPHNSGFIVNAAGGTMTNNNGSTYIFYAIA